ncbi:lipoprotein [bacterium BMS3Abin05]|nr:lipoprotein [bacterium BMS3Abin05]GBE26409.1 lipoprotein [bacterium BMS3Bbin03]
MLRKMLKFYLLPGIACLFIVQSEGVAQVSQPDVKFHQNRIAFPKNFLPGCKGDKWIADDKYRHFVGSAFAAAFGYTAMRYYLNRPKREAVFVGGSFAFSLGVGKELRDKYFHAGCASWKDLTADVLGVAFGLIFYTETIRY